MRNLYCLAVALCLAMVASSQRVYFIYFQSENGTPFYVKMADRIYSSSAPGYLILPNVTDSTYQFSIGIPAARIETRFRVPVENRDRGFLLKNFDYGPGLYDLQTQGILRPQEEELKKAGTYQLRKDDFTTLLSKASGDTSLMYVLVANRQDVAVNPPPKTEEKPVKTEEVKTKTEEAAPRQDTFTIAPPIVTEERENKHLDTLVTAVIPPSVPLVPDTLSANLQPDKKEMDSIVQKDSVAAPPVSEVPPEEFNRSVVRKYSESSNSEGFGLVFHDKYETGVDTIRLLIPNPRIVIRQPDTTAAEDKNLFLDVTKGQPPVADAPAKVLPRSQCPSVASNSDFLKLRKAMAGQNTDEAMVDAAKKSFRSRCYSTEQIRNLSALFLTSAGKYQFFDAAYLHVSDQEQFASLASELKDDYYLKRFKALIGE